MNITRAGHARDFTPAVPFLWTYDLIVAALTREARWRGALLRQLRPQADDVIADLGCGTASFLALLGRHGTRARLIGVDPDTAILAMARRKLVEAGVSADLRHGYLRDAAALFSESGVTKIVSSLVFHHVPLSEKRAGLRAIHDALAPGGELHVADYGLQRTRLMRGLFRAVQLVDGFADTQPNADGVLPELMRLAGFVEVEETEVIATATGSISLYRAVRPLDPAARRATVGGRSHALSPRPPEGAGPSWQTRLLHGLFRLAGIKKGYGAAAAVQAHVRRLGERPAPHRPTRLGKDVSTSLETADGWPVYHTAPAAYPQARQHVVYLHGGGYINEIKRRHWGLIAELTTKAPARCVVPIYPLAPLSTADVTVPALAGLLRSLLEAVGPEDVTVIGDSAGAGMALAAAQVLRDGGGPRPRAMILISPWLDASVSGAEQAAIAARDPLLDVAGLAEAGRIYAGPLAVTHPFVSPLNGDLRGLPPLTLFTGTRDLLHPDSVALAHAAAQQGVPVELHVGDGLTHIYPLLPTPEGRAARARIVRAVAGPGLMTR